MNNLLSVGIIFEKDSDHLMLLIIRDDFKVFDEPFLLQNLRDLSFHFGGGDIHLFEFRFRSVANSCKHIGYWIGHGHYNPPYLSPAGFDHPRDLASGSIFS
jgi:hypothetical protein